MLTSPAFTAAVVSDVSLLIDELNTTAFTPSGGTAGGGPSGSPTSPSGAGASGGGDGASGGISADVARSGEGKRSTCSGIWAANQYRC